MGTSKKQLNRTLIVVLAVIGVLVLVSLVVVFTRGAPQSLDESTPEGVVQRYSTAVIAGDEAGAMQYLTEAALEDCDAFEPNSTDNLRVSLVSTTERDESADVRVLISVSYSDGPFGASEYETEDVFDLVLWDDGWLIDSAPWQLTLCE